MIVWRLLRSTPCRLHSQPICGRMFTCAGEQRLAGHTSPEASLARLIRRQAHHLHYRHQPNEFRNGVERTSAQRARPVCSVTGLHDGTARYAQTESAA